MPNAMTRILKEAILMAGESVRNEIADEAKQERKGLVSYLQWAAIKHPPTYLQLLARVMSTQIETSTKQSEPYKTVEELQQALRDRGLPVERIYPLLEEQECTIVRSAGLSATARQLEASVHRLRRATLEVVKRAFEFIDANNGGAGLRLANARSDRKQRAHRCLPERCFPRR